MADCPFYKQRSGVVFLSLVVATNFMPWMELLGGETATAELAAPAEFVIASGACFLAAAAVFGAWLSGRRMRAAANPRVARPRLLGLQVAILSATLNLTLAAVIMLLGAKRLIGPVGETQFFGAIWFVLVLPTQLGAAFLKGRASIPVPEPMGAMA